MISTSTAVFTMGGMILKKSKSLWIKPSQAAQLKLLETWHGLVRSDRALRYHHLKNKLEGLTIRERQWAPGAHGTRHGKPTKMAYTIAGYQRLVEMGHVWARDWIKRLRQKYGLKSDSAKRPQREKVPSTKEEPPRKMGENPFLTPGHRRRLGLPDALPFDPKKT